MERFFISNNKHLKSHGIHIPVKKTSSQAVILNLKLATLYRQIS